MFDASKMLSCLSLNYVLIFLFNESAIEIKFLRPISHDDAHQEFLLSSKSQLSSP